MERRKINYLNSPLVVIIPYLVLVFVFGIHMILCDLKKNNHVYAQKNSGIVITKTKITDTPVRVPVNSTNYQIKIIKKRVNC